MKVSIVRRVEALEGSLKPSQPESPSLDFDVLVESELEYFSRVMKVLRLKARELGYGDKNSSAGWFDLSGCDPVCDQEVRTECLEALSGEEAKVLEVFDRVMDKGLRLTAVLSEGERAGVKRYNDVVLYFQNSLIRGSRPDAYILDDLSQAKRRYREIMAKHGEEIYE